MIVLDGIENYRKRDLYQNVINFFDDVDYKNNSIPKKGENVFPLYLINFQDISVFNLISSNISL
jgi:hypothetical protein